MRHMDVVHAIVPTDDVEINAREISVRLGTSKDFSSQAVDYCLSRLKKEIVYKYAYIRTGIDLSKQDVCDLGFMRIESKNLFKNLSGCSEAFVLCVTTGVGVDRLLAKLAVLSQAEYFITDALSSAAVESLCDWLNERLKKEVKCHTRFSPGYGDVSLEVQKPLLDRLDAHKLLGITLNESLLMTPMKSITAIMGIEK